MRNITGEEIPGQAEQKQHGQPYKGKVPVHNEDFGVKWLILREDAVHLVFHKKNPRWGFKKPEPEIYSSRLIPQPIDLDSLTVTSRPLIMSLIAISACFRLTAWGFAGLSSMAP